jgi:hypothetical protein
LTLGVTFTPSVSVSASVAIGTPVVLPPRTWSKPQYRVHYRRNHYLVDHYLPQGFDATYPQVADGPAQVNFRWAHALPLDSSFTTP